MPTSVDIDAILAARAKKLATRSISAESSEKKNPVAVVTAGTETFAIPTSFLSFIIKSPPVAAMPNLAPWLRGIAQIRGDLVGVVDIASWFNVPKGTQGIFLAVVENEGKKLGLLLDGVQGFREISKSDIADTFGSEATSHPIQSITKDVVTILDIPKMFASPELISGQRDTERVSDSLEIENNKGISDSGQDKS